MAEILSLSKVRKARARDEKQATASANRVRYGRSKAAKADDGKAGRLLEKHLDGAKREK